MHMINILPKTWKVIAHRLKGRFESHIHEWLIYFYAKAVAVVFAVILAAVVLQYAYSSAQYMQSV